MDVKETNEDIEFNERYAKAIEKPSLFEKPHDDIEWVLHENSEDNADEVLRAGSENRERLREYAKKIAGEF